MVLSRRMDKFKAWLRDFFPSEDGPQRRAELGGFISHAQGFALHNPTMTTVHGNQYNTVTYAEGDRNIVTQMMGLLSQHIIRGAAHDSSTRTPPPRCHPDTRIKLIARITAWFEGQTSSELLLWITGPAGVGKSAVVQTFTEYLAKSHFLGASVFISRPNKCDNPHRVFITIAYQLATRIEAYRNYIVERISLDPELLSGDMQAQFTVFIVEPFVEKKLGDGSKRWGILLDGLDELRGEDTQCQIIQLISTFVKEHPDAPLAWVIASRPESHISNTFDDDEIRCTCWSEHIPIDSTEACEDVERFLRSSFKAVQKRFRHCVPSDWPSNTDFLKLIAAASGLFIYAEVVMQFVRDSYHADPVSRLQVLLSVVDRSNASPTKENPFVHLDALYEEILSSIPSTLWQTTKRFLGFAIYGGVIEIGWYSTKLRPSLLTLRGMSVLFGVTQNVVYASLDKSRSTLKIPDWKVAHKKQLTFLHASFADYLRDSSRSGPFHVGNREDVEGDVVSSLLEIWNECNGDDISIASVESTWHQYCSKVDDKSPSRSVETFHANLFHDTVYHLGLVVFDALHGPKESPAYVLLWKVHMRKLCYFFKAKDLVFFVVSLMNVSPKSSHIGLFQHVQLRDLKFGHFDSKEISPAYTHGGKTNKFFTESDWNLNRPRSDAQLKAFVSYLESLQERSPELKVVIFGGVPNGRIAVFSCPLSSESAYFGDFMSYVVPYLE